MSEVQFSYRLYVLARDDAGREHVLGWRSPDGTVAGELVGDLGAVRHAWRQLEAGRTPSGLLPSLGGWAGLVISPVLGRRRWRVPSDDAPKWSRWEPAEFADHSGLKERAGWTTDVVEGTRQILTGCYALPQEDAA